MKPSQFTPLRASVQKYLFGTAIERIRALDLREPTYAECRAAYREAKTGAESATITKKPLTK